MCWGCATMCWLWHHARHANTADYIIGPHCIMLVLLAWQRWRCWQVAVHSDTGRSRLETRSDFGSLRNSRSMTPAKTQQQTQSHVIHMCAQEPNLTTTSPLLAD